MATFGTIRGDFLLLATLTFTRKGCKRSISNISKAHTTP